MVLKLWNRLSRYGLVSVMFHWISAVFFIGMLIMGYLMAGFIFKAKIWSWYKLHKQIGLWMLLGTLLRILNRVGTVVVRSPDWRLHHVLYAGLIFMPLSGWVMSSSAGYAPKLFSIKLSIVSSGSQWLTDLAWYSHFIGSAFMVLLVAWHVGQLLIRYRAGKRQILRMWIS